MMDAEDNFRYNGYLVGLVTWM